MATSRMAGIPNLVGNSGREAPSFAPQSFSSARVGTSAGSAADMTSVGSVYGTLRNKAPKMDEIVNTADNLRHQVDIAGMKAKGDLIGSGISGVGAATRGKIQADQMAKQAEAVTKGGQFSAMAGIAGGALSLATGGMGGGAGLLGGLFG